MMSFRRLAASALAVALIGIPLAAMLFLTGCRKQEKVFVDSNLAPNTRLTSAPGPLEQANYRVHLYWDGTDPDGYVVAYHFAWDDTVPPYGAPNSPWFMTPRNDSLFKALIDTVGETKRHTFYVRAVDNEGKLDPSPARIRFDAYTVRPVIQYLYRVDGPMDPNQGDPDPTARDTVLMRTPVTFVWDGFDPDGLGAPVSFSYRLDSNPDSPFTDTTTVTLPTVGSGTHFFYVKAKDETGAENFPKSYKFVMNFEPDSEITEPTDWSGEYVVPDGDTIWFRWVVRDKEQIEGVPGESGVEQIWISLDNDFLKGITVNDTTGEYLSEWYFTSNTSLADSHYIESRNSPQGGNAPHIFEIRSRDVEGTFERTSQNPDDRERFTFYYNKPPTSQVVFPAPGQTVCPEFEVLWEGVDEDGEVGAFQYVLDPQSNAYRVCQVLPDQECTSREYAVEAGPHQFRVRAQDNAGCWEHSWNIIDFYVAETAQTEILSPSEDDTVCADFTIEWAGTFDGGDIVAYEYVLDPDVNDPVICEVPCTSVDFTGIEPGEHVFMIRAQDDSGCWAWPWTEVEFLVEECD
jgi:hypothetical protein